MTVADRAAEAAQARSAQRRIAGEARLVLLKSGRPGSCIFFMPGTGGRVEGFAGLAQRLKTSMPVYAIEARGVEASSEPDDDIAAMIDHYLQRVRSLQPVGPYFLLGHSFGGLVAFELAQRLIQSGERVGCLMLLDTFIPKRYWPWRFYLRRQATRLGDHLRRIATESPRESTKYYLRRVILRVYGLEHIPEDMTIGNDIARVMLANDMLGHRWRPEFYPDRLTLFCAADTTDLPMIWKGRVREIEVHYSAGTHLSLIEPPYVEKLAEDISACLVRGQLPP